MDEHVDSFLHTLLLLLRLQRRVATSTRAALSSRRRRLSRQRQLPLRILFIALSDRERERERERRRVHDIDSEAFGWACTFSDSRGVKLFHCHGKEAGAFGLQLKIKDIETEPISNADIY